MAVAHIKRTYATRCVGCGAMGEYLCEHCRDLQAAVLARIAKLWGTVENCFAAKRA